MTKQFSLAILISFTFSSFASGQTNPPKAAAKKMSRLTPAKMSPLVFLDTMKIKGSQAGKPAVVTMPDAFPENWVTKKDINTLITLVNSNEKCKCFLNPLSSFVPGDSANIGGYAIALINAYKQNKKLSFGLYACPKTNAAEAADLVKWWAKQISNNIQTK